MKKIVLLGVAFLAFTWVQAMAQRVATVSSPVRFTKGEAGSVEGVPILLPQVPRVKFLHESGEKTAVLRIKVENTYRTVLSIFGAQATGSLYMVSFPEKIGIGKSEEVVVRYAGGASAIDAISLLSDQGVKVIEVEHDWDPIYSFEPKSLEWGAGDRASTSIYVVTADGSTKVKRVLVLGDNKASAQLKEVSSGRYAISVTPGGAGKFAVRVEFDPGVDGPEPVVYCEARD